MDSLGIDAQVLYPNSIGIGGQHLRKSIDDPTILGSASSSITTPWPRCRKSPATGCCPCRSCRRGTYRNVFVRPSAAPRWATGEST